MASGNRYLISAARANPFTASILPFVPYISNAVFSFELINWQETSEEFVQNSSLAVLAKKINFSDS